LFGENNKKVSRDTKNKKPQPVKAEAITLKGMVADNKYPQGTFRLCGGYGYITIFLVFESALSHTLRCSPLALLHPQTSAPYAYSL
jgi:hypothetical protein